MPTLLDDPVLSFATSAEALEEALRDILPVISSASGVMPILDTAHIEVRDGTLYITGTNLEVYVTRMIDVGSGVEGESCIALENLHELLRTAEDNDRIELTVSEDQMVTVQAKGGTFTEEGKPPADFPQRLGLRRMQKAGIGFDDPTEEPLEKTCTAPGSVVADLLKSATAFTLDEGSSGKEAMKFAQVALDEGVMTVRASNGTAMYRASEEIGGQPKEGVTMIPKGLANHASRFEDAGDVDLYLEDRRAYFRTESKIVSGSLSHREPLDIDKIIPDGEGMFQFEMASEKLRSALVRAGCYTQKEGLCRFIIDKDRVRLKSEHVEERAEMEEELLVEVDTPRVYGPAQIEAVFKVQTLRQCLTAFDQQDVTFSFFGVGRPAFIEAGDKVLAGAMTIAE